FTATRNTAAVHAGNAGPMHNTSCDLALVYVLRDFDARPAPANPYDVLGSGILAGGYALDQEFTVNNFTWNPQPARWDKPGPRTIRRRVCWLTGHDRTTKATAAKFARLSAGQYVALWEEHTFAGNAWSYATTRARLLTARGSAGSKSISGGRP